MRIIILLISSVLGLFLFTVTDAKAAVTDAKAYGYVHDIVTSSDNLQAEIEVQLERANVDGFIKVRSHARIRCYSNYVQIRCSWAHNWKVKLYRNGQLIHAVISSCGNDPNSWNIPDCPNGGFLLNTAYMDWWSGSNWQAVLTRADSNTNAVIAPWSGSATRFVCVGIWADPALQTKVWLLG